jgi:hypothetical protein
VLNVFMGHLLRIVDRSGHSALLCTGAQYVARGTPASTARRLRWLTLAFSQRSHI